MDEYNDNLKRRNEKSQKQLNLLKNQVLMIKGVSETTENKAKE